MRKIQFIGLLLILLLLAACGGSEQSQTDTSPSEEVAGEPAAEAEAETETAVSEPSQASQPDQNLQQCVESYDPAVDYFPEKVEAQYTAQWSVTYHNHYKVITLDSTYDDPAADPVLEQYVLVQCGTPIPEEFVDAEDVLVIEVPVQRMIEAGGGVLGAVEMLDLLDPLIAWRDQFTTGVQHLPNVSAKYESGELGNIGEYSSGWEATLDFEPDLLIAYDNRETIEEARGLGIPYVFFSPFSEGPLGSAEQLKFLALFFNVEAEANDQFNPIAEEYLRLRDLAQAQPEKPSVLLGNINGQGAFNSRPYNRIESILIEDAGGIRVLDESLFDYSGFFPSVSLEIALEQGADADYWFSMAYLPTEETAADFIATDPLNAEFKALQAGNMFHRFGRDEDYFRTPSIRVDELLADMVSILHPGLLPDQNIIHLERVPSEAVVTDDVFPVTVESCGESFTYEQAPQRAVAYDVNMVETMLALGLADQMVAYWTAGSAVSSEYQPLLADMTEFTESWPPPGLEPLLGVEPDFVFGGWGYAFSEDSGLTPETLLTAGVNSYSIRESCLDGGEDGTTLNDTYQDILAIGRIFGIEDRAEALVAEMEAEVAAVADVIGTVEQPLSVFYFGGGEDVPFTAAGRAIPTGLIAMAGGENIFADLDDDWATVSWEEVIAQNPDVILVENADWGAAEDRIEILKSLPQLAGLSAIENERFVILDYRQVTPGLQNAAAVRVLAEGFYPDKFEAE